jgi:hypothetical protein
VPDPRRRTAAVAPTRRTAQRGLVASASVISSKNTTLRSVSIASEAWQKRAWAFYDNVGELRFGAEWVGNGLSRVNLTAATQPQTQADEPISIDEIDQTETPRTEVQQRALELVASIAGGPTGQGGMLSTFGVHATVAGESWLIAEPPPEVVLSDDRLLLEPAGQPSEESYETWAMLSDQDIRRKPGAPDANAENVTAADLYEVCDQDTGAWRDVHPHALVARCWRPHPAKRHKADAPARGAFMVLRQIELLSARIIADAESRLAGAGLLILPSEVEFPAGQQAASTNTADDDTGTEPDDSDSFIEALTLAMTVPIGDRESPAAVVPLVIRVPGEYVDKVQHLTFATAFDGSLLELLDAAIKRLALALDMPPEVLTGMAGVNHWTAWQVEETAITLHLEPLAEMLCHALTEGFLVPALQAEGFSPEDIDTVMVWYDTSDLRARPDKSGAAKDLYDRKELSGEALRRESGMADDDAPDPDERARRWIEEVLTGAGASTVAVDLLEALGYLDAATAAAMKATIEATEAAGAPAPPEEPEDASPAPPGPPPAPSEPPASQPVAASAVLAVAQVLTDQAVRVANTRLRAQMGKGVPGGAAAVKCDDVMQLHVGSGDITQFATLDSLVAGAWDRLPDYADTLGVDATDLETRLNTYVRTTLAGGMPHDVDRLADVLGLARTPA